MSTYTYDTDTFRWSEAHIYGSSRIGIYNAEQILVIGNTANSSTLQANEYENIRGKRHYELSNHLGNVLAVVSDRRTGICTGNGLIAYNAEVVSATDYYAFGSPMPGRQGIQQCSTYVDTVYVNNYIAQEDFSSSSVGGFVAGTGSITVSNPTGDVLHIESIWTSRPLATKTVAVAASTNYTLDFDIDTFSNILGFTESVRVRIYRPGGSVLSTIFNSKGSKSINFTSVNAGNVTIEISQIILGSGSYGSSPNPFIEIDNLSMYYVTMTLDTLTVCSVWDKGYRYGFNTQESDEEIAKGHYTAEYWEYDSRLGRRWNLDPIVKFYLSSYSVLHNNPILYIDIKGDDDFFDSEGNFIGSTTTGNSIRVINKGITFEDAKNNISINTKLISSFNYSKTKIGYENRKMLTKVLGYYCLPMGITKYGSGYGDGVVKSMAYYDPNDGYITISIDNNTGNINSKLDDINNLKSVLVHEKKHRDDRTTGSNLYHYKAIVASIEDPTWENTTEPYKASQISYAIKLFNKAAEEKVEGKSKHSNKEIVKEINIFNAILEKSGSTIKLEYDSKTRTVSQYESKPILIFEFKKTVKKRTKDSTTVNKSDTTKN